MAKYGRNWASKALYSLLHILNPSWHMVLAVGCLKTAPVDYENPSKQD